MFLEINVKSIFKIRVLDSVGLLFHQSLYCIVLLLCIIIIMVMCQSSAMTDM